MQKAEKRGTLRKGKEGKTKPLCTGSALRLKSPYMGPQKSELRMSLPEGIWKIEILSGFDEFTLAESSFFVIERKKQPQKIIVK